MAVESLERAEGAIDGIALGHLAARLPHLDKTCQAPGIITLGLGIALMQTRSARLGPVWRGRAHGRKLPSEVKCARSIAPDARLVYNKRLEAGDALGGWAAITSRKDPPRDDFCRSIRHRRGRMIAGTCARLDF
jgi:hypothetical protein